MENLHAWISLGMLAVMFVAFTLERVPPAVVAVAGGAAFLVPVSYTHLTLPTILRV